MKIQTVILAGLLATSNVAMADSAPDIVGTWTGTHENTDPANSTYGEENPFVFLVQSEVGSEISGDFDFLGGKTPGCSSDPCTTSWTGTITASGQVSVNITGQFGDEYLGTLVGDTLSGTFTGPNGGKGGDYGVWSVTSAPEISPVSATGALTLLFGGLLVLTGRSRRTA